MGKFKHAVKKFSKKTIFRVCSYLPGRAKLLLTRTFLVTLQGLGYHSAEAISPKISIAILIEGGIGDSIIGLAWVKELYKNADVPLSIDIYGRDDLEFVGYMHNYIRSTMHYSLFNQADAYDLQLRIGHFVLVQKANIPAIASKSQKMLAIVRSLIEFADTYAKYAYAQPNYDGAWAQLCTTKSWNRWDELGANGATPFSRKSRATVHLSMGAFGVLEQYRLNKKQFITLHAGTDTAINASSLGTKVWPLEHWAEFCRLFKRCYPNITLVQIGSKSSEAIEGVDLCLLGKTNLHESAILLKYALLHVDGESGLVHLKRQLMGKSVVLFGPTPVKFYGYKQNLNIVSSECSNCMWLMSDWFFTCLKKTGRPECMTSITPEIVMEAISGYLAGPQKKVPYAVTDVALYTIKSLRQYEALLDNICSQCDLEKKSISEHIFGPCRTYIHASKQWEYPYAADIIMRSGSSLRIADIGGGRGVLAWYLAKQGHDVTVYDINYQWDNGGDCDTEQQFLQFAASNSFTAEFGSIFNIPAEDDTFDVLTCISVVEHIRWKEYAFTEMLRVLKPGGKLIVTYDLVTDDTTANDALRVEVFSPQSIIYILEKIGISVPPLYSNESVTESIKAVREDNVCIAPNMTVGGFVITKEC